MSCDVSFTMEMIFEVLRQIWAQNPVTFTMAFFALTFIAVRERFSFLRTDISAVGESDEVIVQRGIH